MAISDEGNGCDNCHRKLPLEKVGIYWLCPGCAEVKRKQIEREKKSIR